MNREETGCGNGVASVCGQLESDYGIGGSEDGVRKFVSTHWKTAAQAAVVYAVTAAASAECGPFVITCAVVFNGLATAVTDHYLTDDSWRKSVAEGIVAGSVGVQVVKFNYILSGNASTSKFELIVTLIRRAAR